MNKIDWEMIGYELGWDIAHYDRKLPDKADKACSDGYHGFQHGERRHVLDASVFVRKWLQVRLNAYVRRKEFHEDVSPRYLEGLLPPDRRCPVTHEKMTFGEMELSDWSIERADNTRGYVPGNIIVISTRANKAKSDHDLEALYDFALGKVKNDLLTISQWRRLVELIHPMTPNEEGQVPGVWMMFGQTVAEGMPRSNLVELQTVLSRIALGARKQSEEAQAKWMLNHLYLLLCKSKTEKRSFRSLMKALYKRASAVDLECSIWETLRVQRLLFRFLDSLKGNPRLRLEEALDQLEAKIASVRQKPVPRRAANDENRIMGRAAG